MIDEAMLQGVLEVAGVEGEQIGSEEVEAMWGTLGVTDDDLQDEFVYAVASLSRSTGGTTDAALGFRLGQWKLDLAKEGIRGGVLSAFVAAALALDGLGPTGIGIGLATIVLPSVLSLERVEVGPKDERLLLHLRLRPEVQQRFMTEDQLYDSLPAEARDVVNRFDFAEFVQRIREGGIAQEAGGFVRVRREGERRPLISWS